MANQWLSWLPFLPADVPADFASPREVAAFELAQALPTLSPNLHVSLAEDDSLGEGFHAVRRGDDVTIFGSKNRAAVWRLLAADGARVGFGIAGGIIPLRRSTRCA